MDAPTWEESEPVGQPQGGPAPTWEESTPVEDEGALMAAGRGALRNAPAAQQITAAAAPLLNKIGLADKPDYSGELQHLTEAAEQAKAQHPVAYGTGAAAGTVAPLAIPGVGGALEAAPILGSGVLNAVQSQSDTDLTKPTLENAKDAAIAGGIGAATAGIGGKLMSKAPEALEGAANNSAVKSTIWNRNYLGHLDPEEVDTIGQFMRDHGMVDKDAASALEQARIIKDQYGQAIRDIGADAQALKNPRPYLADLANKAAKYEGRADPDFLKMGKTYDYAYQELKSLGPKPTFAQLQELKSLYGDHAFNADHSVANKAAADVYGTIKDMMAHIVKDSPGEYGSALKGYSYSHDIVNGLEKKVGSLRNAPQGIGMGSISRVVRQLPGPVRAALGTAAAATGHPYVGAMAALPEIMNPALHSQALSGLAKMAPSLGNAAQIELANALESKFGNKEKRNDDRRANDQGRY